MKVVAVKVVDDLRKPVGSAYVTASTGKESGNPPAFSLPEPIMRGRPAFRKPLNDTMEGSIMKKIISPLILLAMLLSAGSASACVGRILTIGVSQTSSDLLLAEIVSVLVNERTGTNVKVLQFRDTRDLYAAVRKGEVGLVVEHAERGLEAVGHAKEGNPKISYETAKKEYRKAFNMVWLDPVGLSSYYAPVVTVDTMSNLPALPKLLNKLSGVLNDETFGRLVKQAKGDDKPRRVARDFLKSKKLI